MCYIIILEKKIFIILCSNLINKYETIAVAVYKNYTVADFRRGDQPQLEQFLKYFYILCTFLFLLII